LIDETVEAARLPANWRDSAAPPELARFGDEFAERKEHCLLWVPSVLAPGENNCLINTAHPDNKRMIVREVKTLQCDSRMFRKKQSRRRH
jgi:RES domain-containing protein